MRSEKVIEIILYEGNLQGLRVLRTFQNGQLIVCPRKLLPEAKLRQEFEKAGVYLLIETPEEDEGNLPKVYIGKASNLGERLLIQSSDTDSWDTLICFTSNDNTFDENFARYLESKVYSLAYEAKRCILRNGQRPRLKPMKESLTIIADNFLDEFRLCLSLLGYRFLEKPNKRKEQEILYCKASGSNATGYETSDGFVVSKGSEAVKEPVPSLFERYKRLRLDLRKNGVFKEEKGKWVLTQDYTFNSPSEAGAVFSGNAVSGLTCWKNQKGVELKELQKRKAQ